MLGHRAISHERVVHVGTIVHWRLKSIHAIHELVGSGLGDCFVLNRLSSYVYRFRDVGRKVLQIQICLWLMKHILWRLRVTELLLRLLDGLLGLQSLHLVEGLKFLLCFNLLGVLRQLLLLRRSFESLDDFLVVLLGQRLVAVYMVAKGTSGLNLLI